MDSREFRAELRRRLEANANRVLLRIASSPDWFHPLELTGHQILEKSDALAAQYALPDSDVILLLLPHSPELFLLHLGLLLRGKLPAILAWPTSRIDPEKYQRNLLHQLRNLPASQVVTLPQLARNLQDGLPYPATGLPIAGAEQFEKHFLVPLPLPVSGEPVQRKPGPVPEDALFLQFSGGTTGAQKAITARPRLFAANLYLARPLLYAWGLLLFLAFDDRDAKFIYFQF